LLRKGFPSVTSRESLQLATFSTDLGWMALVASETTVRQLVFGHASAAAARAALDAKLLGRAGVGDDHLALIERLTNFAAGKRADFLDVRIDLAHLTPFQRRVVKHCRAIPYGQTRSYGELAVLAGSPRAARAVGSTMASNRFSIIVPCHRIINADGSVGRYGAPGLSQTKRRMLEMEARWVPAVGDETRRVPMLRRAVERV
jgi:O-6-methylguanine DNA methyltransferase